MMNKLGFSYRTGMAVGRLPAPNAKTERPIPGTHHRTEPAAPAVDGRNDRGVTLRFSRASQWRKTLRCDPERSKET